MSSFHPLRRYSRVAVVLHWLVALLMCANVVLVWIVDDLPDDRVRLVIDTHKSIGITVLGLFVLRVLWRWGHPPPALEGLSSLERWGAKLGHLALYVLMLGLPLSGWMHDSAWKGGATHPLTWFGLVPWPRIAWIVNQDPAYKEQLHNVFGVVHGLLGKVLYVTLFAHVAGALKHQFLDRQRMLQRMWF